MPIELQVKLLRVLETGTFMRVGSTQLREADVRVIAATNRAPELAVADHKLREDLFYRLNVFPIELPPLRERREDVPLLAEHFLAGVCQREGHSRRFTPKALQALQAYRWPGNVRELRNVVQRVYVMADGDDIGDEWLPRDSGVPLSMSMAGEGGVAAPPAVPSLTLPLGTSMAEAERQLILATFQHFNRHKERTAAALGVSMKTLYNRLKEYSRGGDDAMEATAADLAEPPAGS